MSQTEKLGIQLGSILRLSNMSGYWVFRGAGGLTGTKTLLVRGAPSPHLVSDMVITYDFTLRIKAAQWPSFKL